MTKLLGLAAVCGIGAIVLFAQSNYAPMKVRTGLWQSTRTITIAGLGQYGATQQPRTYTHKGCLTRQDLAKDPFADLSKSEEDMNCKENLIRSTGSDAEVEVSCSSAQMSSDYHVKLHAVDQERVIGTGQGNVKMFGNSVKSDVKFQSKWLQERCPANVN